MMMNTSKLEITKLPLTECEGENGANKEKPGATVRLPRQEKKLDSSFVKAFPWLPSAASFSCAPSV